MALKDDIRLMLRIKSESFDSEVEMLIDAAKADMERVGVRRELVNPDDERDMSPLVKQAISLYAKACFGYDNSESSRFMRVYRQTVTDLMNSDANIAAQEVESE